MDHRQDADRKAAFEPVANRETRVLLLGSLPGAISLERRQYYANPTNQFWRLMEPVVAAKLTEMEYDARLATLLNAGVGLWDVIGSAKRAGSLDSAIRNYSVNQLETALACMPSLRAFAFNGAKAFAVGRRQLDGTAGVRLIPLPSSSAAYCAMPFEVKQAEWASLKSLLS